MAGQRGKKVRIRRKAEPEAGPLQTLGREVASHLTINGVPPRWYNIIYRLMDVGTEKHNNVRREFGISPKLWKETLHNPQFIELWESIAKDIKVRVDKMYADHIFKMATLRDDAIETWKKELTRPEDDKNYDANRSVRVAKDVVDTSMAMEGRTQKNNEQGDGKIIINITPSEAELIHRTNQQMIETTAEVVDE